MLLKYVFLELIFLIIAVCGFNNIGHFLLIFIFPFFFFLQSKEINA